MKVWAVCLVLMISAATTVEQAWANSPENRPPRVVAPKFKPIELISEHPSHKAGGPYPGCNYKTTPRMKANNYNRGCSKSFRCRH